MRQFKTQAQIDEESRTALALTHTVYPVQKLLLIYARQSTKNQVTKNKESAAMQTVKLRQLGLQHGWLESLTRLFIENMYDKHGNLTEEIRSASGSLSIDERAGLRIVTETIEQDNVGAVMCFAIDRLFRDEDMVQPAAFVRLCKQHHVLVITPTDEFDFNNPRHDDRKRFLELAQAAADYTTHHVKGRMLVGKHEKAMRGEYIGASVPSGYMLDDCREHYVPSPWSRIIPRLFARFRELDADLAAFHREIYGKMLFPDLPQEYLARMGRISMSHVEGGYTIKGRTGLIAFLTNPAYIGHIVYKGHLIRDCHPPIVNEQDFFYAFNALSPTTLDGDIIERPEKVVRYTQHHEEDMDVAPTEALLSGRRPNGKAVITSPDKKVYALKFRKEVRYTARTHTGFRQNEFSIQASTIDTLVEERLFTHLDPSLDDAKTLEQSLEQVFVLTDEVLEEVSYVKDMSSNPNVSLTSMEEQFQAVQTQQPTRLTTDENLRAELQRAIARLDREYDVNFDILTDKELHDNREKKARQNKQLADLDRKQEKAKQSERNIQEATALLQSKNPREQWLAMPMEKRHKFIRLVTEAIIIEKVADTWIKLTIKWYAWIAQYKPHQAMQQGLLFVDTGYILRRRSTMMGWSDEENDIIRAVYLDASRKDILECLPNRSWESIRSQAVELKVVRTRSANTSDIPDNMSIEDSQFMQAHNLSFDNHDKHLWWALDIIRNHDYQSTKVAGKCLPIRG